MDFYKVCKEGNINAVELLISHNDLNLGLWGAQEGGHMNIIDRIFSKTTTRIYLSADCYIEYKYEQLHNFTKLHESLIRVITEKYNY